MPAVFLRWRPICNRSGNSSLDALADMIPDWELDTLGFCLQSRPRAVLEGDESLLQFFLRT